MERQKRPHMAPYFEVRLPAAPGGRLVYWRSVRASAKAWKCLRCALVTWTADAAPRCRRCGFWETAS